MDMVVLPFSAAKAAALMLTISARAKKIEINFFMLQIPFCY
jgi:hypothetical protein